MSEAIPSDSKNKEAAFLTTSWVTNPANSALQIASAGNTDAGMRRSIFNDTLRQAVGQRPFGKYELEGLAAFTQTWPSARFIPTIPEWPNLQDVLAPAFQSVIGGQVGTRDGLSAAADGCEKILAEAGYYKRGA